MIPKKPAFSLEADSQADISDKRLMLKIELLLLPFVLISNSYLISLVQWQTYTYQGNQDNFVRVETLDWISYSVFIGRLQMAQTGREATRLRDFFPPIHTISCKGTYSYFWFQMKPLDRNILPDKIGCCQIIVSLQAWTDFFEISTGFHLNADNVKAIGISLRSGDDQHDVRLVLFIW